MIHEGREITLREVSKDKLTVRNLCLFLCVTFAINTSIKYYITNKI